MKKGTLQLETKIKIEMGQLSWIIQVDLRCNHKYPYKRKEEGDLTTEVGHVMMEARGWSDVSKRPGDKECGQLLEDEKDREGNQILPRSLQKECGPAATLISDF